MKKLLLLSTVLVVAYTTTAQITAIPDPAFEQELVYQNIDSDGIINGQISTADLANVTELTVFNNMDIANLTGISGFTNLENLSISHTSITTLDVSQNLNLKKLYCGSNMLTNVIVNPLLEEINVSNGDVGPWNAITQLDLQHCPDIKTVIASAVPELSMINLKNGNNNGNMTVDVSMWFGDGPPDPNVVYNSVCIEVDDEELAQSNQFPYSEWTVYDYQAAHVFSENCALGTHNVLSNEKIVVYPNPATDVLNFNVPNGTSIEKAIVYDISGRAVKECSSPGGSISLSGTTKGIYLVQIFSGAATQIKKIVVE